MNKKKLKVLHAGVYLDLFILKICGHIAFITVYQNLTGFGEKKSLLGPSFSPQAPKPLEPQAPNITLDFVNNF